MPSSVIAEMSYDPDSQILEIEYRAGRGVYRYFEVPAWEWDEFLLASSKGTYLNESFKQQGYPYMKLEGTHKVHHSHATASWPSAHEKRPAKPASSTLQLVSSKKA